jgi:hypothetical protein
VGTWRDLAPAVGFYAANASAVPRPAPLDRALFGVGQVVHAARLVARDPALRRAALWPTLLTLAGCALLAGLATADRGGDPEASRLPVFQAFLVSFVAISSMPPTLLQRMWLRVALEARRALGLGEGERAFDGVGHVRLVLRESTKALRQFVVVSIGLAPLLGLVRALPLGHEEAVVIGSAWTFYWVLVDAFELPIEVLTGPRRGGGQPWFTRGLVFLARKSLLLRPFGWLGRLLGRLTRPWHEEVEATERRRWETLGFGLAAGAVLVLPVLGLFFRSVAMVAATGILALDEPGRGASSPGSA